MKTINDNRGMASRRAFIATTIAMLAASCGCKSLNENPKNTRFWFPALCPPSREERELRERNFPEGGDPYVDAEVGPKSISARPRGWDIQRSRTSTSFGVVPDDYE